MTSDLGKLIGDRYELTELAGQGGMATVWRATMHGAAGFTRQVAVKKIRPEFRTIRNYIDMFVEEARVGSDLNHPNIVQIHDFLIDPEGSYYLVMEWVEGMDLGSFVRAFNVAGVPVPWMLIAAAGVGALRGLGAAHERRKPDGRIVPVIHRDVSPHNILVGVNGVVKLTDFGLARARDRVYSLTAPGTVKGKLTYLPPEVTHGQPATAHSDIFALGNVLWETLAGRPLFRGSSDLEVFRLIRDCIVPPISSLRADVPAPLAEIIHCALAREPAERFPTARAMAKALAEVLRATRWQDDAQATLGAFVTRARSQQGIQESEVAGAVAESEHQDTWAFMSSPRSEGLAGSIHDIQGAAVEFTSARPPAAATPGSVGEAEGSSVGSIDIEFTDAAIPVPPPKSKT